MLRALSNLCIRLILSAIMGILIFTQSGLSGLAFAGTTACDQTDFTKFFLGPDGLSTYAITKYPLTWQGASSLAKTNGGRLAVITGTPLNNAIFSNLSSSFVAAPVTSYPGKKAWIDLVDANNIPDWSMPGQPAVIDSSRFAWADGTSTFSNWVAGQPDGYCTAEEMAANPSHICYGEQWTAINTGGVWSDEGNHGTTPIALPAVVEWPNTTLDCVSTFTPPSPPIISPLPGSDTGQLWCTNSTRTNLLQCVQTTDGQQLCPLEKAVCNETTENPICPSGSALNTTRDMCQAAPVPVCSSGYTWDASIDKCVKSVICPDGGTFNAVTDRCEKIVANQCPSGYTYDSGRDVCWMAVNCPGGTFDAAMDRCEAVVVLSCSDLSYTYNSSVGRCEKAPVCPSGMAYSNTYSTCTLPVTFGCASGYTYNATRARCEFQPPTCPGGYTYNATSNKCESTSTYAATATYSCPSGGTLSGSTCSGYSICSGVWKNANFGANDLSNIPPGSIFDVVPIDYDNYWVQGYANQNCIFNDFGYFPQIVPPGGLFYAPSGTWFLNTSSPTTYPTSLNYTCPSGGTLSGSTCSTATQVNPTCAGGSFDGTYDVCWANYTPSCSQGTYDGASGLCIKAPTCSNGLLDGTRDLCYQTVSTGCPSGYSLSGGVCTASPVCNLGAYNVTANECEATITRSCGTYTWSAPDFKCIQPISCPSDSGFPLKSSVQYSSTLDKCLSDTVHNCVTGTTYNGLPIEKCEAVPICNLGIYSPLTHGCQVPTCPGGTSSCYQIQGDTTLTSSGLPVKYCSPNNCQSDTSGWVSTIDTPSGLSDKTDDGAHDATGNCLGQIYLFNGNDMRCRVSDLNGAVGSWAKLAGSILIACTGVGAALATEVLTAEMVLNGALAAQVISTLATAAAIIASNVAIDAATGKLDPNGLLIQSAVTLVAQGLATYIAPAVVGVTGGTNFIMNDAGGFVQSLGNNTLSQSFSFGVGDALTQPLTNISTAASNLMSTPTFQTFMDGIKQVADQFSPAIQQGMLGGYTATHCCYPDKLSPSCESSEMQEATEQHNGMCHIVGSYCSSEMLFVCMVKKQTSCCFQSLLARIMHEQGRPQLQSFSGGWGSPRNPMCRGFTPEEFQGLNFSIMDLSEWEASLNANMDNIQSQVQGFIGSTGTAATQAIQNSPAYKGGN